MDVGTGEQYLDMFTFFASSALGINHPALPKPTQMVEVSTYKSFENAFLTGLPQRLATAAHWLSTRLEPGIGR